MHTNTEDLWRIFSNQLKYFILKRVPDEHAADDILQEVFLKIHRHIDSLQDQRKLESWIYQITRNAITDYYRGRKNELELSDELYDELYTEEEITKDTTNEEIAHSLKAMIETLPAIYREPLLLTEYEGLTQKEMAAKLGLSLSCAKSRVQRGKAKLKETLLECCHFEFDRLGQIINYQPKCDCCTSCGPVCEK